MKRRLLVVTVVGLGMSPACTESDPSGPVDRVATESLPPGWLEDVAEASGIDFTWTSGAEGEFLLPEIIGGGVALLDADGDNDLDVYLVQGGSVQDGTAGADAAHRLYRNDGKMVFTDISNEALPRIRGYGMGVAVGDYDGDGDPDLYVTNVGPNLLLENVGGRFRDNTEAAGVGGASEWGSAAAFLDYDADGDLDLYASNYLAWSPETEMDCLVAQGGRDYCAPGNYPTALPDRLYRNNGDGTFVDISEQSGITSVARPGLGVCAADYDGDGRLDIFVANDGKPDVLWRNLGNGRFEDVGLTAGCAIDNDGREKAGMGVGSTDFDDDGDIDLIVCNLGGESDSLFRNEGSFFVDTTSRAGVKIVTTPYTRFGLGWLDFDNDGWLDLYEATGKVQRTGDPIPGEADPYAEEDVLLRGTGPARYQAVSPRAGTVSTIRRTSRAAGFGDLDNDGRIDIIVVNRDRPVNVYRNITNPNRRWIQFRVLDRGGVDAVGGTLSGTLDDRSITRPIQTAYSYFAANDPRVHIGLGTASELTEIKVRWPDGTTEVFGDRAANSIHVLHRGEGTLPSP